MRRVFKNLASRALVPLTRWYLRKERTYTYQQTKISVLPGVFHPGLFSSTGLILDYLEDKILPGQTFIEIGSGTGLISVVAAKAKALVTALDLSQAAVENTKLNAQANEVLIDIIQSDLLSNVRKTAFDWVIINPPYYARHPRNESDLAWYCGEDFEYFRKLFKELPEYVHATTNTVMVLTKGCDVDAISTIGRREGFEFVLLQERRAIFDGKDMLYRLNYVH